MLEVLHKNFDMSPDDPLYKSKITFIFMYSAISRKNSGYVSQVLIGGKLRFHGRIITPQEAICE